MWIRPTSDTSRAVVRDHKTGRLVPPEGMEVPDTDFSWRQRLLHGDVELGRAPAPKPHAEPGPQPDYEEA